MTQSDENSRTAGPILGELPPPPNVATRLALTERLHGHTTSTSWLPAGLFPVLDELREEQLRLRRQVVADVEALGALDAKFKQEDAEHTEQLRQAHRDGSPASSEDRRTPVEQRGSERAAVEERLWAGVHVFAEHADRVIEAIREHEDEWLVSLRSRLAPAREKRHRAERLLVEAREEEFRLYTLGRWLQANADDHGFGRQPVPPRGRVPDRVSPEFFQDALERPWHKAKPWNGAKTGVAA
ncbi:MAG: hypothetical protein M3502_04170 [Actinomycetota bacterium]|nr:hypothetical protein [Actinomycetota bacterium]